MDQKSTTPCPSSKWRQRPEPSTSAKTPPSTLQNPPRTRSGCAGTTTASGCSTRSNTRPPSTPSSASPPCAPATLTPSPTWPSFKSPGKNTTTPAQPRQGSALLPGDPRALYYRALVERNQGQSRPPSPTSRPSLKNTPALTRCPPRTRLHVLPTTPIHRGTDAYEQLQAIDPDDLAAHYQLAIIYRRPGDKQKAAIEAAKFADQKDDPTAQPTPSNSSPTTLK